MILKVIWAVIIRSNRKILVQALDNFGLKPEDIDIVFIIRWHLDHCGNLEIFNGSEIIT